MGLQNTRITVGDIVTVSFNHTSTVLCYRAKVLHEPAATGDSWVFQDEVNNMIYYVSEGCTISKRIEQNLNENERHLF